MSPGSNATELKASREILAGGLINGFVNASGFSAYDVVETRFNCSVTPFVCRLISSMTLTTDASKFASSALNCNNSRLEI
jgi:hypothetical protein